jgi:preprotein translocase subunit SecA
MSSFAATLQPWPASAPIVYAQRIERPEGWLDRLELQLAGLPRLYAPWLRHRMLAMSAEAMEQHSRMIANLSDAAFWDEAAEVRALLRRRGLQRAAVATALPIVREAARRELGLFPHRGQMMAALALLKGMVAEMGPGEGKTLAATLAACAAGCAGVPVHVVAANDFLARRDYTLMEPLYRSFGLSVGLIAADARAADRVKAYRCDISYVSVKSVVMDYLRDRVTLGGMTENIRLKVDALRSNTARRNQLILRGLHFAVIDDADHVLIDEGKTPLIISKESSPREEQLQAEAILEVAGMLRPDVDFRSRREGAGLELTDAGRQAVAAAAAALGQGTLRESVILQALSALYLIKPNVDYSVQADRIQILNDAAGRELDIGGWHDGLLQLIESKEGCKVSGRKIPLARISYQRFFRRYNKLAGLTATARLAAPDFWRIYRLPVAAVAPERPPCRERLPDQIFATVEEKWDAIVARSQDMYARGRPVLIATVTREDAQSLVHRLNEAGLSPALCDGASDEQDAKVMTGAGRTARVTIAIGQAGRGTDVPLSPEVSAAGGLHVIRSELGEARRIDLQAAGRCGRRGEPGSEESILCLEDPNLKPLPRSVLFKLDRLPPRARDAAASALFRAAQRYCEKAASRGRRELLAVDHRRETFLAFTGGSE